jgi:hypothetical protein
MSGTVTELKSGWLDKREFAGYLSMSVSWIEKRMHEGMPHAEFGNRIRFKVAEAEPWLEEHGHLTRKGGMAA